MDRYLKDTDVAKMLHVSRNTVWRWTREGLLAPPVRITPGCTRWRESDLRALTDRAAAEPQC